MKLVHVELETPLEWDVPGVIVLAVENPRQYRKWVGQLLAQSKGQAGDWVLSLEGKERSLAKDSFCWINFFDLTDTQKKIQTKLLERLVSNAYEQDEYLTTHRLLADIRAYMDNLMETVDVDLQLGPPDLASLLRAMGIKWLETDDLLERLVQLVNVISQFNVGLLVMVGLCSYLEASELALFWHHCALHDMCVLDMEPTVPMSLGEQQILVVDRDLCEFVVKKPMM